MKKTPDFQEISQQYRKFSSNENTSSLEDSLTNCDSDQNNTIGQRESGVVEAEMTNSYFRYYFSMLLSNAAILSLYAVQTFSTSPPCLAEDGGNITHWFDIAFTGGLVLHSVNFVFFAFIEPTNRQIV